MNIVKSNPEASPSSSPIAKETQARHRARALAIVLVPFLVAAYFYVEWITQLRLDVLMSAAGLPVREAMFNAPTIYALTTWLGESSITMGPVFAGVALIYLAVGRVYPYP